MVAETEHKSEGVVEYGFRTLRGVECGHRPKTIALRATDLDFALGRVKLTGNVRLYQRANGRWYVRFTLSGKRRMLSTGEQDRIKALLKISEIVK